MLFKNSNPSATQGFILTGLLTLLASCSNTAALESLVSADPQLTETKIGQTQPDNSADLSLNPDSSSATDQNSIAADSFSQNNPTTDQPRTTVNSSETNNLTYGEQPPQAEDSRDTVSGDELAESVAPSTTPNSSEELGLNPSEQTVEDSRDTFPDNDFGESSESSGELGLNPSELTPESPNNYFDSEEIFTDLDQVPEPLQQPLKSVARLGILTPYTGKGNVELTKFAPNEAITRGEYARWLIAANNRYYSDSPSKKIYITAQTNQPAFKDINQQHPDFGAIQSLAEVGLIPSRLTEDSTNLMFRANAPLTREDLITWKVPLDIRQALPKASLQAIEESWGFKDAANIDSAAIRALYADFQNGDRSNIRRIFGYTTLFQPQKTVTRAEAAVSLSYFGFQGDGITAREILDSEAEAQREG
ncbi:MAG: S-layer homology domain-containing protein [Cyanobacteria bacterium J06621_8]